MSQTIMIRDLLRKSPITQKDAILKGCFRLASRVHDLRDMGYIIDTDKFAFGHLATYTLVSEPGQDNCAKELGFKFGEIDMDSLRNYSDGVTVDGDLQRIGISISAR